MLFNKIHKKPIIISSLAQARHSLLKMTRKTFRFSFGRNTKNGRATSWLVLFVVIAEIILSTLGAPTAYAATINAVNLLGQVDSYGNPKYTTNSVNNGSGVNAQGFDFATSSVLDRVDHRFFVADANNHRVLAFRLDANNHIASKTAIFVLGASNFTTIGTGAATQSTFGRGNLFNLTYDSANKRLFVSDGEGVQTPSSGNNRVLCFSVPANADSSINGENAIFVLGQSNFTSSGYATTRNTLSAPDNLIYDPVNNRLFVSDTANNRVMVFSVPGNATSSINGKDADYVIGQTNFTSGGGAPTQSGLNWPSGMSIDTVDNRLFVNDCSANRVMVFSVPPATNLTGINAAYVLGQIDFSSGGGNRTQNRLFGPDDMLGYDQVTQRLFVADNKNNRVMVFSVSPGQNLTGENAQNVLGQSNYSSNTASTTQNTFLSVNGSDSFDPINNILFVKDRISNRIMEFDMIRITNPEFTDGVVGSSYSQTITVAANQGTSLSYGVSSGSLPAGLTLNSSTGVISGTPTALGSSTFTIEADDNYSTGIFFDRKTYTIATNATALIPHAPTVVIASGGRNGQAVLAFTPSANDGGSAITGYTVTSSPDNHTAAGLSSPITLSGLTNGTAYTFTIHATNSVGDSVESVISNTLTPAASFTCTWSATTLGNWSTASNWTNCGNMVPQSGEAVVFDGTSTQNSLVDPGFTDSPGSILTTSNYTGVITQTFNLTANGGLTINGGTWAISTYNLSLGNNDINIAAGKTLTIGTSSGTGLTVQNFNNTGTIACSGISKINISDSYSNAGTVSSGSSTFTFTATTTGHTLSGSMASKYAADFYNLTFNGPGGSWTLNNNLLVRKVLTIQAGTFNASDKTVTLLGSGGPFVNAGTFAPGTSTFVYASSDSSATNVVAANYYNLQIINPGTKNGNTVTKLNGATGATVGIYSVGSSPQGIAIDASGNVWVANFNGGTISKLNGTSGSLIGTYDAGGNTRGVAVDTSNNIWVVDSSNNDVVKLDSATGGYINQYSVGVGPQYILVDASNNVWVTNYASNTVSKLNGTTGATIGTYSVGSRPENMAVDASGNVWVTNSADNTVSKLNGSTGATIGTYSVGSVPYGISADAYGNVWVTNSGVTANTVSKLNGTTGATIGTYSVGSLPYGISADASGNVWVKNANTVSKLDCLTGATIGTYKGGGAGSVGIAVDASGDVWVGSSILPVNYNFASGTFNVSHDLTIGNGGSGDLNATVATNNPTISVAGSVTINSGSTLTASASAAFSVASNFTNNGVFTDSGGTVTLNGQGLQTITAGGTDANHDFTNLSVTNNSIAGVSFADSAAVTGTFIDTTQDSKLTFADGAIYTFANITINGAVGQPITMTKGAGADGHWYFNVAQVSPAVTYVAVNNSDATGSSDSIDDTTGGINNGSNINWDIPVSAPGAPTIGTATAGPGVGQATVTFTPPINDGGSAITGYTVTSTPGSFTGTGAVSPITVTGLANGATYTFTVHATNAIGDSAESTPSNGITPSATITDTSTPSSTPAAFGTTATPSPLRRLFPWITGATTSSSASFTTIPTDLTNIEVGQMITFDASSSGSNIVKYEWDFGDGTTSNEMKVDHKYDTPGRYTVTLTTTDKSGNTSTVSKTIDIRPSAPTITNIKADGTSIVFEGKSFPKATVNLTIHSNPYAGKTVADDKDGKFSYTLEKGSDTIGEGGHTVLANAAIILSDNTELTSKDSKTYDFNISLDNGKLKVEMGKTKTWKYVSLGLGLLLVIGIGFVLIRARKRRRR